MSLINNADGIVSGHREKLSCNEMKKSTKMLERIKIDYFDFCPQLLSEKLIKLEEIKISKETVRQIMIATLQPKTMSHKNDKPRLI